MYDGSIGYYGGRHSNSISISEIVEEFKKKYEEKEILNE